MTYTMVLRTLAVALCLIGIVQARPAQAQRENSRGLSVESAAGSAQSWALLIGIDDYAELPDNQYCARDVQAIQDVLIAGGVPAGNVFVLHSNVALLKYLPSKANLQRQLEVVPKLAGPQDRLLVVFCGHAVQSGGKSYLCPIEARLETPRETLVAWDMVCRQLAESPAAHKLLVADVARGPAGTLTGAADKFLASLGDLPGDVALLTSCRAGQTSRLDKERETSFFMRLLRQGLEGEADRKGGNGDGQIGLAELFGYVREQMKVAAGAGSSAQTPVLFPETAGDWALCSVPQFQPAESTWPVPIDNSDALPADLESLAAISPASLRALRRAWNYMSFQYGGDRAIADANDAIQLDPNNRWAYVVRGFHYRKAGDLEKALADFRKLGIPLPCFVFSGQADLKLGDQTVATLFRGDKVYVTKANGEWFWVEGAGKAQGKKGWVNKQDIQ